jgi:hypothetical protein
LCGARLDFCEGEKGEAQKVVQVGKREGDVSSSAILMMSYTVKRDHCWTRDRRTQYRQSVGENRRGTIEKVHEPSKHFKLIAKPTKHTQQRLFSKKRQLKINNGRRWLVLRSKGETRRDHNTVG